MVKISAALPTHMKAVVLKIYDGTPQSVAAEDFSVPRRRRRHFDQNLPGPQLARPI